jgi:acetyl esterase/lipase
MPSAAFEAFAAQLKNNPMPTELKAMREAYEGMGQMFPLPPTARVAAEELGGRPAEWHIAEGAARSAGIVLYLHGGGYAIGSLATHRHLCAEIARLTGLATVALDYRLGPEHRFPAAVDDALAAYRQILAGYPGARVVFAGDSAGAGLVMATLLAARDAGLAMPAGAYCMSPWVDLVVTGQSLETKAASDPLASRETLLLMAERYLGDGDAHNPLASPILGDLRGLPPLFIQVGSAEVLLDDSIRLAQAAGNADVTATLEIWPHMIHVWPFFFPAFPEAEDALGRACDFLRTSLRL